MSLVITNPPPVFERIAPIKLHIERLHYIEYIFNLCLYGALESPTAVSPAIKVGFIEKGSHVLERMFVVEDSAPMILFVINTPLKVKTTVFIRTAYIITRSKVNYIHISSGVIFKDLLDYCLLEPEETSTNLYFYHKDKVYTDINEIISKDPKYKETTRVFLRSSNQEIGNNLFMYSYMFKNIVQYKLGYYINPANYEDYFHPMSNISTNFGALPNIIEVFTALLTNPQNVTGLINIPFEPNVVEDIDITVEKSKKERKAKMVGMSLIGKIRSLTSIQEKRVTIGWFLCEIMYRFFYDD